eukprot:5384385-Alexandrium_andersonii.AAC.1
MAVFCVCLRLGRSNVAKETLRGALLMGVSWGVVAYRGRAQASPCTCRAIWIGRCNGNSVALLLL